MRQGYGHILEAALQSQRPQRRCHMGCSLQGRAASICYKTLYTQISLHNQVTCMVLYVFRRNLEVQCHNNCSTGLYDEFRKVKYT